MKEFLNTEHCLAIAGAFIAFIGACATLVNIANSKSDALANRYREVTREYRGECKSSRRTQLHQQIDLYVKRVGEVYCAQQCLFRTIRCFILSITIFIGIGLFLDFFKTPDDNFNLAGEIFLIVIGLLVAYGTFLMFRSIKHYFRELLYAKETFENETGDCRLDKPRPCLRKSGEGYSISGPGIPYCWIQGKTEEEALNNIQDVIWTAYLEAEDKLLRGEAQLV
jgi:hypothetical protein